MKKSKTVLSLLLVMLLSLGLTACGGNNSAQPSDSPESSAAETTPAVSEATTNTVTDELGREVTIPENPQKVLALTSAVMQALYNIEVEPVGKVEEFKVTEEGIALPSVGQSQEINIESVYALNPDLIIASSRFHAALEEELEQSGAVVYYFDPDKVGDIPLVELTAYIGKLLAKEDIAAQYVESVYAVADELKQKVAEEAGVKTGIIIQDGDTIAAAQSASSYGSMLSLLGIENIVPEDLPNAKKASFVPFDVETIIASNPDVIFIMTSSKDTENNKAIMEKYKNDPQWSSLDAVKNNRLLILPFSVNPNRSTPQDMVKATAEAILKSTK
ncbi:MAG: ABC transporter substrate-binding protein [Anaerotignum sp.]|nr:ABC transporter substrate-binding protein [Anaerotignum sp.]